MTAATADAAWADARASNPTESLRQECRTMARRRAALAAATSLIPIPGIDLATDLALMARLINRINEHFGLSDEQIGRLSKQRQALIYRLLAGIGYWSVNTVAMRHIAHCERIVDELQGHTKEH